MIDSVPGLAWDTLSMSATRAVRESLRLLASADRRKLFLATLVQVSTALLDLLGVLLLGLVGALAVATVQSEPPPPVVDDVINRMGMGNLSDDQVLAVLAGTAAVVLLAKSVLASVLLRRVFRFLASRQASVSGRLTRALLAQPLTFVQQRPTQETSYALVQGAGAATLIILGQAVIVVSETALLVVLGVALLLVSPLIALTSILFFALVAVALQYGLGNWATRSGEQMAEADIASLDAIQEVINAYREVIVSDRRSFYVARIQALRWQAAQVASDLQFIWTFPKYVFEVALVLGGFVLAAFLFSTQDAVSAVGTLALFLAAATRIMPSILRLQGAALTLRNASGLSSQTLELANALPQWAEGQANPHVPRAPAAASRRVDSDLVPSIHVQDVTFFYPGTHHPALHGVSLKVPAGSSIAIVGSSGAGKSTLVDVILGIVEPDSGSVDLGGMRPGPAISRWPGAVSYVPQDVVLANGSVRSNVALGLPREDIDDQLVWDALERARLTDMLIASREGLDTEIGERGTKLSGGQRQRLGIARALYTRPRLLVLDEATSSLDAETELAISSMLAELEGSVTTVVIAHRLSTVRHADQVLYLDEGRAVACGTFDQVRLMVPAFNRQADIMGLS